MSPGRWHPELLLVGVDHTTAPLALRERLAFTDEEIPGAVEQLVREPATGERSVEQAAILATCDRVEVYAATQFYGAHRQITRFLAARGDLDDRVLAESTYVLSGEDVAHRLAATAAGMHSLVLGEAQIQGQVRWAVDQAMLADAAGPELRRVFEAAIAAGRRVRAETGLGRGVASVSQAGVELARERLGGLRDATVLLIGSGDACDLAARQLGAQGTHRLVLVVVGRDLARARALATRHRGEAWPLSEIADRLAEADVVISATAAPGPVVRTVEVERGLEERRTRGRPARMLLVDLAVPHDIEPATAALTGVQLYGIDDLEGVVTETRARRAAELPAAYAIIHREVRRFSAWLHARQGSASYRALRLKAEALRASELATVAARLETLSSEDREAVEAMTRGLVDKVVGAASAPLRQAAPGFDGPSGLDLLSSVTRSAAGGVTADGERMQIGVAW